MRYGILVFICFAVTFISCKKDDDGGVVTIPPSLLSDVAPEDDETIREFLNTHFYNYEEFKNPPEGFDYKIVIDTIAGDNANKKPMMESAVPITFNVSSSHLGLSDEEENIEHTLYYIEARKGGGGSPTFVDSTLVRYQGYLLDGTQFDESKDFSWTDISRIAARGFADGYAQMYAGTSDQIMENADGTYNIDNSGIGLVIMPSGMAYFNRSPSGLIPTYSILMFEIELGLYVEDTDHDNDGIPSIQEDLNGNGFLGDDNTDMDEESIAGRLPNFRDVDDDGDGVLTRDEIIIDNGELIFPDADGDGTPDYLDPDTN
ncbi:MAG: hypothetical protein RIB79_03270 [Allomuricauda sp.]|jgi:FKBP-type peptidyl-prolyl cis-trans isomerase FkpA